MSVSAVSGLGTTGTSLTSSMPSMGKEEFLKLLVAQLAHQDPLEPMENSEFVAQLSQFSSVEQLMNANDNLATLQMLASSQSNTNIAGLIGKVVEATGDTIRHTATGPEAINFDLSSAADHGTVSITDAEGNLIKEIDFKNLGAGQNQVAWDGRDSAGNMVSTGNYSVKVEAFDADGNPVNASTQFTATVTGVSYATGVPLLEIGDGTTIQVADVVAVRQAEKEETTP